VKSYKQIHKAEWNFSECPKEEYEFCLRYELAREIPSWVNVIESNFINPKAFKLNPPTLEDISIYNRIHLANFFIFFCSNHFPHIPWLEIKKSERNKILKAFTENSHIFEIHATPDDLRIDNQYYSIVDNKENNISYYSIKVNWNLSNDEIRNIFNKWIKSRRPPWANIKKQGSTSYKDIFRKFGAYKLFKACSSNVDKADFIHTFYKNQANWITNKTNFEKLLKRYKETADLSIFFKKN
jgi:hypothetical protein